MAFKTHGLRGSELEELINRTNDIYKMRGLALIQKIPTPIIPIRLDGHHHITLAYFGQKSTVDYIGAVQGIPVCFDAKECKKTTFPLSNIHAHQVEFMRDFTKQGGVAFFLLYYTNEDLYYYLPFHKLEEFWDRAENGGRKSFRMDELDNNYVIEKDGSVPVPFLHRLAYDIENNYQTGQPPTA